MYSSFVGGTRITALRNDQFRDATATILPVYLLRIAIRFGHVFESGCLATRNRC